MSASIILTPPQSPIRNTGNKSDRSLFDSPGRCRNNDDNLKLLLNHRRTPSKKERRVISLDSSSYLKYKNSNTKMFDADKRALSAESAVFQNQVMNRLSFENIDLLNTPLSSLKSCSEYNKPNFDDNCTQGDSNSKEKRKSFWSKIFNWRGIKKNETIKLQERSPSIYIKSSVNENDNSPSSFRLNPTNLFEDEDHCSTRTYSTTKQKLRHKNNSSDSTSTYSYDEKNQNTLSSYFYSGTTEALDYLFGLHASKKRKLPMEIELKNLKEPQIIYSLSESEAINEMRNILRNMDGNDPMGIMRRVTSFRSLERINYLNNNSFNDNIQNINNIVNNVEIEFNIYSITTWLNHLNYMSVLFIGKLRTFYPLTRDDDSFYESIRIQPFSSGSYLRAMLVSGFSSLYFNVYNIVSWPEFAAENFVMLSSFHKYLLNYLYFGLIIQLILNLFQLPFRLKIHYQCWESSRAVEVDSAIVTLRNMLLSDYWLISKSIGHLLDIMIFIHTVLAELYLWFGGSDDPLRSLIISLCSTSLLALVVRIIVATIFSLSMHDPQVLSDARRRGLSKWDLEVLPAFVFTNLEEVNNLESCSICLTSFNIGELLITLPCDKKHSFHAACIRQWLQRQNSCPLCQKLV